MAKRTPIKDLKPSQLIEGVYAVQNCQLGQTKAGKPFIKCLLQDKSGRTPGRMWNASEELFAKLPTDGFVWLEGQTQPYQGEIQIIIQQIAAVDPSPADLVELLPCSAHDPDDMFADLSALLYTIQNPALKTLVDAYLFDDALMDQFKRAPAAMTLHHAYLGGLLEHTLCVTKLAEAVLPLYPQLNRDLVLAGVFLHDLGKCAELTWERGFGYSEDGHLVGHIARGLVWLNEKAQQCAQKGTTVPEPVLRVLEHIIVSHHGLLEHGALKLPATPEAIAVSMLDNIDAKMQMSLGAAGRDEPDRNLTAGGNLTEKVWALGTRIYRPDPTTLPAAEDA